MRKVIILYVGPQESFLMAFLGGNSDDETFAYCLLLWLSSALACGSLCNYPWMLNITFHWFWCQNTPSCPTDF